MQGTALLSTVAGAARAGGRHRRPLPFSPSLLTVRGGMGRSFLPLSSLPPPPPLSLLILLIFVTNTSRRRAATPRPRAW